MDHKAWPWKKKSGEKTAVETDKDNNISTKGNDEEIEKLAADKTELEKNLKNVSDKLTSLLSECNAKDILMQKQANDTQEALVGLERTKVEATDLKRKLDAALDDKKKSEERSSHLDAGLKECMRQLQFVREEQERRMHDALTKTSKEYEKELDALGKKLTETCKKLSDTESKNTQLAKSLLAKNQLVEDLNREKDSIEADFKSLMGRLESKEKENVSLKYEVRVLEKELEIRNEEREFSRRTAESSHKLHLENVKEIAKLEAECRKLRILVRKRLPGPAAMARMKNEVRVVGIDSLETRRRRFDESPNGASIDSERINNLVEQLCLMEEENKTLREALDKKINELQFSRNIYSRTATRLLEFESQFEVSSKSTNMEPSRCSNVSRDVSLASVSEFDNDDKVSCTDSWASSALLSEHGNLKNKKPKGSSLLRTREASEVKLMDDFAEMEKLAMASVNNPLSDSVLEEASNDDISKSIRKVVEIIEGLGLHSQGYSIPETGYTVRVLQWKSSEVSVVVQQFLSSCNDLVNRKTEFKSFAEDLSVALDWIVNHCFSLQDVSSMRQEIKKRFDLDGSQSESDEEVAEKDSSLVDDKDENTDPKHPQSDKSIAELQKKLETLTTSMAEIGGEAENQKVSCKNSEELKAVCMEVKQETASVSDKEVARDELTLNQNQTIRTEREITVASEKLAECRETILNLGKKLKELSSNPTDNVMSSRPAAVPDSVRASGEVGPEKGLTTQRSSLRDKMMADDDKGAGAGSTFGYNETFEALEHILLSDNKGKGGETTSYAIVSQKKGGGFKNLWRKLLWRKKKSKNSNKIPIPFASPRLV